jgi:hypothetical protein
MANRDLPSESPAIPSAGKRPACTKALLNAIAHGHSALALPYVLGRPPRKLIQAHRDTLAHYQCNGLPTAMRRAYQAALLPVLPLSRSHLPWHQRIIFALPREFGGYVRPHPQDLMSLRSNTVCTNKQSTRGVRTALGVGRTCTATAQAHILNLVSIDRELPTPPGLQPHNVICLALATAGLCMESIGEKRQLTLHQVKTALKHCYSKLPAGNRNRRTTLAFQTGIFIAGRY